MEMCEECGCAWRKTKTVKLCPNCNLCNKLTEEIEDECENYDEDYFTTNTEQDYIKETKKMPYKKRDTQLSKEFIIWLEKRWIKERAELEKEVKL